LRRKRNRFIRVVGVALVLGASSVFITPATATTHPLLIGTSGRRDAYVIRLALPNGQKVKTIPAGTYTFAIHDYSRIHNFALGSQTANKRLFTTGIKWIGTTTYTLRLAPGHYAYACSAHFATMNGTFVVARR